MVNSNTTPTNLGLIATHLALTILMTRPFFFYVLLQ